MGNAENKVRHERPGQTYLLVADEAVVLLPESDTAVRPADSEGVDHWVPLQLRDLVLAAGDLEVWDKGTLIGHKDNAGCIRSDGEHDVDLTV